MTDSEVLTAPRGRGGAATPGPTRPLFARSVRPPHGSWRRRYAAALLVGDIVGVLVVVALVRWTRIDGSHTVHDHPLRRLADRRRADHTRCAVRNRQLRSPPDRGRGRGVPPPAARRRGVDRCPCRHRRPGPRHPGRAGSRSSTCSPSWSACRSPATRSATSSRRRRRHGQWTDRVLAVGNSAGVADLIRVLQRRPGAGLSVVASCLTDQDSHTPLPVPVIGGWADVTSAAAEVDADVVAIAGGGHGARASRELGWALEGTGRQLVTALELSDVSPARGSTCVRLTGPLAWVGHPQLTGPTRLVKRMMDLILCSILLVLVAPVFAVIAILIRTTSPGPVFFKQKRLGKDGNLIKVWKFRTMVQDAEARRDDLVEHNMASNLLYFKIRDDPRITPVGWQAAPVLARRAAPADQRLPRFDVARRAASAARRPRRVRRRVPPPAAGQAGPDRSVAGQRPQRPAGRRGAPARPVLRRELVARPGRHAADPHRVGRGAQAGGVLS